MSVCGTFSFPERSRRALLFRQVVLCACPTVGLYVCGSVCLRVCVWVDDAAPLRLRKVHDFLGVGVDGDGPGHGARSSVLAASALV